MKRTEASGLVSATGPTTVGREEDLTIASMPAGFTDGNGGVFHPQNRHAATVVNLYQTAQDLVRSHGGRIRYRDPGESSRGQMNCSEFLLAVLKRAGVDVAEKPELQKALALNYQFDNLAAAVRARDPRTKGAVHAISSNGLGDEVSLAEVLRSPHGAYQGLIVQYWTNDGRSGHTGIVKSTERQANGDVIMTLFGSNKDTEGTGEVKVNLSKQKYVYFARLRASG
jgi:hypothetical protein